MAIVVLGLGTLLGLLTFAVVDGVLFKSLPYHQARDLFQAAGQVNGNQLAVSAPDIRDWAEALPSGSVTAYQVNDGTLGVGPIMALRQQRVRIASVDASFFEVLGVRPALGTTELVADRVTRSVGVVVAHASWVSWGRPDINRAHDILSAPDTQWRIRIVGVARPDFVFPDHDSAPDVILPIVLTPGLSNDRRARRFQVLVRRPAAMSTTELQSRLDAAAIAAVPRYSSHPFEARNAFQSVALTPLEDRLGGPHRRWSYLASGFAFVLVLLTTTSVGSIAVTRWRSRIAEIAVRLALGATVLRVYKVLVVEASVLAVGGTALGLGLALLMLPQVVTLLPTSVTALKLVSVDERCLLMAAVLCVINLAVLVGPSCRYLHRRDIFRQLSSAVVGSRRGQAWRSVAQVSVSTVVVFAGMVVLGSWLQASGESTGFDAKNLARLELDLGPGSGTSRKTQLRVALDALSTQPGVGTVGVYGAPFVDGAIGGSPFALPPGASEDGFTEMVLASRGTFDSLALAAIVGRLPTPEELDSGARVAVVSDRVARAYWPGSTAVGQVLTGMIGEYSVIGIVPGGRYQALDRPPTGEIFVSAFSTTPTRRLNLLLRMPSESSLESASVAITNAIAAALPAARVGNVATARKLLRRSIRDRELHAWLFGSFSLVALVTIGVGVLASAAVLAADRRREVGLRMALGATPVNIVGTLVSDSVRPVFAGLLLAGGTVIWLQAALQPHTYGGAQNEPVFWVAAVATILTVAVAGAAIPALRAARTNPLQSLNGTDCFERKS